MCWVCCNGGSDGCEKLRKRHSTLLPLLLQWLIYFYCELLNPACIWTRVGVRLSVHWPGLAESLIVVCAEREGTLKGL